MEKSRTQAEQGNGQSGTDAPGFVPRQERGNPKGLQLSNHPAQFGRYSTATRLDSTDKCYGPLTHWLKWGAAGVGRGPEDRTVVEAAKEVGVLRKKNQS